MIFARSVTSLYDNNDIRKFKMGTPAEVWSTMARCWEVEPTSERIVEDIMKLDMVLDKIIEAEGCVVFDLFLRTGKRGQELEKKDGKGSCKNKPRSSQYPTIPPEKNGTPPKGYYPATLFSTTLTYLSR